MKIGVMTFYYQSTNYGGNLQAYALVKALCALGYDAEQISYKWEVPRTIKAYKNQVERIKALTVKRIYVGLTRRIYRLVCRILGIDRRYYNGVQQRGAVFEHFNNNVILHSQEIYLKENIRNTLDKYDVFVCGSDQVWNPDCYLEAFHLTFVGKSKTKIAYAASVAQKKLNEEEKEIFKDTLGRFDAVSVRERHSIELLEELTDKKIRFVADPCFLLGAAKWGKLCTASNININSKYIFCYFLGNNTAPYHAIRRFAKRNHYKIVNIPFMADYYIHSNYKLCGDCYSKVDPIDFIKLVKDAEYIFTDSFHAVVFSIILKKQFFVFDRDYFGDINVRIKDILKIVNLEYRFCDQRKSKIFHYIGKAEWIKYGEQMQKLLAELVSYSKRFIQESISNGLSNACSE